VADAALLVFSMLRGAAVTLWLSNRLWNCVRVYITNWQHRNRSLKLTKKAWEHAGKEKSTIALELDNMLRHKHTSFDFA